MTRKDFVLLAAALKASKPDARDPELGAERWQWALTVRTMAEMLRSTNPLFDSERFVTAAGLTGNGEDQT